MPQTIARRKSTVRRGWTRADVKDLRQHSRDKTPVKTISRALKRTPGSLSSCARNSAQPSPPQEETSVNSQSSDGSICGIRLGCSP